MSNRSAYLKPIPNPSPPRRRRTLCFLSLFKGKVSAGRIGLKLLLLILPLLPINLFAQKADTTTRERINGKIDKAGYYPKPLGFVSDFEHNFTEREVHVLDSMVSDMLLKINSRDALKGIQLAVVTVTDSMFGNEKEMSDYATKLGDKWSGNQPNNKAIIIAYGKQIRKVAIVVGAGIDHILTAQACQDIMSNRMAPQFQQRQYFKAILEALNGISTKLNLN